MKKILIITCVMCVMTGITNANEPAKYDVIKKGINIEQTAPQKPDFDKMHQMKKTHEAAFEQKLGLTEVQKFKARELRKTGHAKMKPVMEQIKVKKQEAEMVRNSKLTVAEQEEKLTAIDKDLDVLKKQAKEIKKQNMKAFEAILTKDQKKILKNMKKEGRKNFEQHRKDIVPPPCKG